jgi:hypothetical protein
MLAHDVPAAMGALEPGCAAEGMAVPLAVKDLRPLRGACGVLDREPPARHRQMEGRQKPASDSAAQSSTRVVVAW